MVELVPSRVTTQTRDAIGGDKVQTTTARTRGLAPYRRDGSGPVALDELLPQLGEPELARDHEAAVAPTRRKLRRTSRLRKIFAVTTLVVTVAGAGLAIDGLLQDRLGEAAVGGGLMLGGIIGGLVGVVVTQRARPSLDERIEYNARTRILVPDADDLTAASRGLERYNRRVRERCSGAGP